MIHLQKQIRQVNIIKPKEEKREKYCPVEKA